MALKLTKYQQQQAKIIAPILHDHSYVRDHGTFTKLIASFLGVIPTKARLGPSHPMTAAGFLEQEDNSKLLMSCCIASTDEFIVTGHADGQIKIYDTTTGKTLQTFDDSVSEIKCCCLLADDTQVVTGSNVRRDCWEIGTWLHRYVIRVWDIATGDCVRVMCGHTCEVNDCCVSSTNTCVVSASSDCTLRVWDLNPVPGKEYRKGRKLLGHNAGVTACRMSSTDEIIVSASWDGTVKLWDVAEGTCTGTFSGHANGAISCRFVSSDQCIVSTDREGTLRVWDVATGICTRTIPRFGTYCFVSGDEQRILGFDPTRYLRMWHRTTNKIYTERTPGAWACAGFSSTDDFFVCGSKFAVHFRDTNTLDYFHDGVN